VSRMLPTHALAARYDRTGDYPPLVAMDADAAFSRLLTAQPRLGRAETQSRLALWPGIRPVSQLAVLIPIPSGR
jgi:hypothetical protein